MLVASLVLGLGASPSTCLHFDEQTQVVVVPYQKKLDLKEATIELWFKADPSPRYYGYLLSHNYGDLGYGLAIHGKPNKVFSQAPGMAVPMGVWTHIAVVDSKNSGKLYVNGEVAAAWERIGPLNPFSGSLFIGNSSFTGEPGGEWTGFVGSIDEVRIWSKPRTQAQIRKTMNRYVSSWDRNLLAYFPFDEGKGQFTHDWSGHLISGSLGNSFQPDSADPSWLPGKELKGRRPGMRERRG